MTHYEDLLSKYPVLQTIGQVADEQGISTCVVGGFVRDLLLHRPSKDIDIVCEGDSMILAQRVAERLGVQSGVQVYKTFGTAMVRWQEGEVEFVRARKESYAAHSRNPTVVPSTLAEDLSRRDFTINTLAIFLNKARWGELIDPLGGKADLAQGLIRTPLDPDTTFSDDPLRMMRAIRFATQLRFTIDSPTLQALSTHAERLKIISQERITDELNKIIMTPQPSVGFKLLFDTGLLQQFFPLLSNLQGREKIGHHTHKDNFYHTLQVLDNIAQVSDNLWLRWAAILHDIAKPLTKKFDAKAGFSFHGHEDLGATLVPKIFRQLKLPLQEQMDYVADLVRLHLRPIALAQEVVTDSALRRLIYEAGNNLEDLMVLCRADITSSNSKNVATYLKNFERVEEKLRQVEGKDRIRNLQPVITGEIIMEVLSLKPSPAVGQLKNAIKDAIIEGKIPNEYEPAFQYMMTIAKEKGLIAS
jgi:putative nucleotidyltransferase with HDIG domain